MNDIMFTRTALTETARGAGVTADQARTILEAAGVRVQPEKPALPTEPGSVIIATEVRGETGEWVMLRDEDGDWFSAEMISDRHWSRPDHIAAWTEAVVVPAGELEALAGAQDTLEELAKMGVTEADRGTVLEMAARLAAHGITHHDADRMVKQHYSTAQHAAPAEGEPIDVADVQVRDRVRVELESGDEVTFTVRAVNVRYLFTREHAYRFDTMRSVRLLHREEA